MWKWMLGFALALTVAVPTVAQEKEPAKEEKKTESKDEKKEEKKEEKKDAEEGRKATLKDYEKIDYNKPYKTKGNTWTTKTTTKYGEMTMVSYMKFEVTEVGEKKAKYKIIMLDEEKKETYSDEHEYEFYEVEKSEDGDKDGDEPEVELEGRVVKIKVEAGEFECLLTTYKDEESKYESKMYMCLKTGIGVKSWTKGEEFETTSELTEYKVS